MKLKNKQNVIVEDMGLVLYLYIYLGIGLNGCLLNGEM